MKPKILSLREMWALYKLLGKGMGQQYLLDEIIVMLETMPPENIKKSMKLMYKDVSIIPLEMGLMFVKGLKHNNFFAFQTLMEKLS